MIRSTVLPVLLLVGLPACAAGAPTTMESAVTPGTSMARFEEHTYTGEAGARRYQLFVPSAYTGSQAVPLVVMLHGCTQDAADFAAGTRVNLLAEENPFLVLYPEQPATAHPQKCWNWYDPAHQHRGGGEPALIAGMTREVMREHRVDPGRVYVAGVSAGGAMAVIMAATYPDLYTAAASHSGMAYGAASSVPEALAVMRGGSPGARARGDAVVRAMGEHARVVPIILFHGAADPVVGPANTEQLRVQWEEAMKAIADLSSRPAIIEEQGTSEAGYPYTRTIVRIDPTGPIVIEEWIIDGLGHAWSGGSTEGTYTDPEGPDASREIIRFFLEHTR